MQRQSHRRAWSQARLNCTSQGAISRLILRQGALYASYASRLPSALGPPNHNGNWDGALSLVGPEGKPVILYDCFNVADCQPVSAPAPEAPRVQSGDPTIVGVAWPVDPTDANLTVWRKDKANPIKVTGAGGYAGPSTLFPSQDGKSYNLLMADRGKIARYVTSDLDTTHNWIVADAAFYNSSSGPSEFVTLPTPAGCTR